MQDNSCGFIITTGNHYIQYNPILLNRYNIVYPIYLRIRCSPRIHVKGSCSVGHPEVKTNEAHTRFGNATCEVS